MEHFENGKIEDPELLFEPAMLTRENKLRLDSVAKVFMNDYQRLIGKSERSIMRTWAVNMVIPEITYVCRYFTNKGDELEIDLTYTKGEDHLLVKEIEFIGSDSKKRQRLTNTAPSRVIIK